MTIARRRLAPPLAVGALLVTLVPLVAATTSGRDDHSVFRVYLAALGWTAAIVVATALFVGFEVQRHRRFRALTEPTTPPVTGPGEPDRSIDSRSS